MLDARAILEEGVRYERGGALDRALERYEEAARSAREPAVVAEALRRQADVHRTWTRWDEALELARRSAAAAEAAGLDELCAEAWNAEAAVHQSRGDFPAAEVLLGKILERTADDRIRGIAHQNLATIHSIGRDFARAADHFRESSRCFERAGYVRGLAIALTNFGAAALEAGSHALAEEVCERALEAARAVGDQELVAVATKDLAEAVALQGDTDRAEELMTSALGYFAEAGSVLRRIECLRLLGDIRRQRGDGETARRSYETAHRLAREIGARVEEERLNARLRESGGGRDAAAEV